MQLSDEQVRAREILAACLEEAEAYFDRLIDDLCQAHPEFARVIRETLGSGLPLSEHSYVSVSSEEHGSAAAMQPHLGPYRPIAEIGRGGQGTVYLAEDPARKRSVAIKVLDAPASSSPGLLELIRATLSITARLDLPGICTVSDVGTIDDTIYLVMPFIEGETLASTIRRQRDSAVVGHVPSSPSGDVNASCPRKPEHDRLELPAWLEFFEEAALALHGAHEAGVLHGDIKPGNLMRTSSGDPIWLDLALSFPGQEERNALRHVLGLPRTTAYLSPELVDPGGVRPDRRSDIFSLAVTLFETITLEKPFQAPTRDRLLHSILRAPHPKLRRLIADAPRTLEAVLGKALEKKPKRRYADAREFAEELRRVRERRPVRAKPISLLGHGLRWAERRPLRALSLSLIAFVLTATLVLGGYTLTVWPEIRSAQEREHRAELEDQLTDAYHELCTGDPRRAQEAFDTILRSEPAYLAAIAGKALALFRAGAPSACLAWLHSNEHELHSLHSMRRLRDAAERALSSDGEPRDPRTKSDAKFISSLDPFLESVRLMLSIRPQNHEDLRDALVCSRRSILLTETPRLIYHAQLAYLARITMDPRLGGEVAGALRELWPHSRHAARIAGYATASPRKTVR